MENLVSKPLKEPQVIDLQEYAKSAAASVQGININKLNDQQTKTIQDFINRKY